MHRLRCGSGISSSSGWSRGNSIWPSGRAVGIVLGSSGFGGLIVERNPVDSDGIKQSDKAKQRFEADHRMIAITDARTNHRIEHPGGNAPRGCVRQANVDHVAPSARRAENFDFFPEQGVIRVEDFGRRTKTGIV